MYSAYRDRMKKNGEVYASGYYLLAALLLAVSAADLHKLFDSLAGLIWLAGDIGVLILKIAGRGQKIRAPLMFGASALGLTFFLIQSLFHEFAATQPFLVNAAASLRLLANSGLWVASICGLLKVCGMSTDRPVWAWLSRPGRLYIFFNLLLMIYGLAHFAEAQTLANAGYVAASILWVLASDAIRIKFDFTRTA